MCRSNSCSLNHDTRLCISGLYTNPHSPSKALSIMLFHPKSLKPFPSLLSLTMAKVTCTCGCGRNITCSTRLNHLKGCGTTGLRARVLAETKSLKIIAQEPQNRGSKKQSSSNPDQGSSHKRLKASQPTASPDPKIFEVETGLMDPFELTLEPEVFSTAEPLPTKSNLAVERTLHIMKQRWGARRDKSHNDDGNRDHDWDEDENENENKDKDEDENMGEGNEDENDILGLSTWDLLGADFEHEAAALGLS